MGWLSVPQTRQAVDFGGAWHGCRIGPVEEISRCLACPASASLRRFASLPPLMALLSKGAPPRAQLKASPNGRWVTLRLG